MQRVVEPLSLGLLDGLGFQLIVFIATPRRACAAAKARLTFSPDGPRADAGCEIDSPKPHSLPHP